MKQGGAIDDIKNKLKAVNSALIQMKLTTNSYSEWINIQNEIFDRGREQFELLEAIHEVTIINQILFATKHKQLKFEIERDVPDYVICNKALL